MKLIEVVNKKTEKEFHQVCEIIYREDINYIPHVRQDLDKIFDRYYLNILIHKCLQLKISIKVNYKKMTINHMRLW